MIRIELEVLARPGLHLTPASEIVKLVEKYACEVFVVQNDELVSAGSVLALTMMAAARGALVTFVFDGKDEKEAAEAMKTLFRRFGREADA